MGKATKKNNNEMYFLILLFCLGLAWGSKDCGDCFDERAGGVNVMAEMNKDNVAPTCNPGPNQDILFGTTEFVLNATRSDDPDESPSELAYYWVIYETPYEKGMEPFSLDKSNYVEIHINATELAVGYYRFILYVSDGQAIVPCIWQLRVVESK